MTMDPERTPTPSTAEVAARELPVQNRSPRKIDPSFLNRAKMEHCYDPHQTRASHNLLPSLCSLASEGNFEKSRSSKDFAKNTTTTKPTQLSFDPMTSSIAKRRYSERSPSTTSATGENEDSTAGGEGDSSAKSHLTEMQQPDPSDIRLEMNPIGATENFADLPDPEDDKLSPDEFLHKLVFATCGMELEPKKAKSLEDFFAKVTDAQVAAYTMAVVSACRNNDLDALKKLHSEEGQTLNCFNRFGESLLTMACRRGFEDVVEYLLQQAGVDVRISDDSGRTVLHDACWNPSPQLRICGWIMDRDPVLWFVADNRGCTPFQYARPEHWGIWKQFLLDHKGALQLLRTDDVKSKLSKQTQ